MNNPSGDYDSPWKEALGEYLREALALLFPEVHADIDWDRPYESLDNELQQVVRDAESGRRYADRLVRVWLLDGSDLWLLIHIEVQSQQESGFPKRMYMYNYRIDDRYQCEVVSLAVLADDVASWRPDTYERRRWSFESRMRYPIAKLTDWLGRRDELLASDNPFATVVIAHLAAQETRGDARRRELSKLALVRRLYDKGYSRERVLSLFRFIDWLLALPAEAEERIQQAIEAIEEERKMPYVATYERMALERGHQRGLEEGRQEGIEEGRQEGRQEGLQQGLQEGKIAAKREVSAQIVRARFGAVPDALAARIEAADEATLDRLIERAATAASVDALR